MTSPSPGETSEKVAAQASPCPEVDAFFALIENQLSSSDRAAMEQHIDECPQCQILLAEAVFGLETTLRSDLGFLPAVGSIVGGRYRIERFVTRGGMGDIYEAHDIVLGENVALKTVTAAVMAAPNAVERLKAEVKLSRRVGHPHTCRIYDFVEQEVDGQGAFQFLTMEFIEGETLGSRVRREGKLSEATVLAIGRQLLDGLAAAHRARVLHRDFKSDNVMLRSRPAEGLADDAVIMDFGLACALHAEGDRLTSHTQALMGSAAYMAPEQVEGSALTEAADMYAFGVVLFEMLTGTLPFRGGSPIATALLRLRRPPPRPSTIIVKLNPAWDQLVLGCMQRDVDKRMSCRQALAELSRIERGPKPAALDQQRRRAGVVGAFVAGAVSVLAGLAIQTGFRPRGDAVAERISVTALEPKLSAIVAGPAVTSVKVASVKPASTVSPELLFDLAEGHARTWQRLRDPAACDAARRAYGAYVDADPPGARLSFARSELERLGACSLEPDPKTARSARIRSSATPTPVTPPTPIDDTLPPPSRDPLNGFVLPSEPTVNANTAGQQ